MADQQPSYEKLEASLAEAERTLKAIREEKVDAFIGKGGVYLLHLKEMQRALRRSGDELNRKESELEAVIDTMSEGLVICDMKGNVRTHESGGPPGTRLPQFE